MDTWRKRVGFGFRPGILTSLMGVSGAGKTTLMDCLAGRKTGTQPARVKPFKKRSIPASRKVGTSHMHRIRSGSFLSQLIPMSPQKLIEYVQHDGHRCTVSKMLTGESPLQAASSRATSASTASPRSRRPLPASAATARCPDYLLLT